MIKNFQEILKEVKKQNIKKVSVAVAQDKNLLEAIKEAHIQGIVEAILIGDKREIEIAALEIGMNLRDFELINEPDNTRAALKAIELVRVGRTDMVMKGLIDTKTFLRAILDKEVGLRNGKLMSHIAVFEVSTINRLIFITDAAFNMYPELKDKIEIVKNAVTVAKAIGIEKPKVAAICAVEVVNENMKATVDAAILSKMNDRGQIKDCIIDGPLALDNALSEESASHKGIISDVAGKADILLMPNIESGNIMYKTLTYTSNCKNGGLLVGTSAPVILTSRSDSKESKIYSIALGSLVANYKN